MVSIRNAGRQELGDWKGCGGHGGNRVGGREAVGSLKPNGGRVSVGLDRPFRAPEFVGGSVGGLT